MKVFIYTNESNGEQVITNEKQSFSGLNDCTGERVFLDGRSPAFKLTSVISSRYSWNLGLISKVISSSNLEGVSYIDLFKRNPESIQF